MEKAYKAFCISGLEMHAHSYCKATYRPGDFDLLYAEADEFVFYSEFFFFEAYNNALIRVRAADFVFNCLFELGVTVF